MTSESASKNRKLRNYTVKSFKNTLKKKLKSAIQTIWTNLILKSDRSNVALAYKEIAQN